MTTAKVAVRVSADVKAQLDLIVARLKADGMTLANTSDALRYAVARTAACVAADTARQAGVISA